MMKTSANLIVEKGEDQGRAVVVPEEGCRLGRSSRNDVVLRDPLLSRHHCRVFFKDNGTLWVADLGSANETLVNDQPIQEAPLHVGDRILVGNTVLRVLDDGFSPSAPVAARSAAAPVDLGLGEKPALRPRLPGSGLLLLVAALVAAFAAVVWAPKLLKAPPRQVVPPPPPSRPTFEISYEKVQADAGNIFRYALELTQDGTLAVQIDDLASGRHVRKAKPIDADYAAELAVWIEDAGFFALDDKYVGIQPAILEQWDLSVTVGRRTHRTVVVNRVEPDIFKLVREKLEDGGKNELGLWAIQFSPEKLLELSQEAYLLGRKLYDERDIKLGNLAAAIKSFQEAEWYLETVEPKPEFYAEILGRITDCRQELDQRHDDRHFRAERAIRLRDWSEAARELRDICEIVPDRADSRHADARRKLLDVEMRLKPGK